MAAAATGFPALREGVQASVAVLRAPGVLARIAGPWIVLACAGLAGLALATAVYGQHRVNPWVGAIPVVMMLAGLGLLAPMVVVGWSRWIVEGRRPAGVDLPGRAVVGCLWRLWLFVVVFAVLDNGLTERAVLWAASHGGIDPRAMAALVGLGIWCVAILAGASWALRLPAIAVGDRDFTTARGLIQGRRLWPALPLGLVLALAPFLAAGLAVEAISGLIPGPRDAAWRLGVEALVLLVDSAALAAGAGYVARAYQWARTQPDPAPKRSSPPPRRPRA